MIQIHTLTRNDPSTQQTAPLPVHTKPIYAAAALAIALATVGTTPARAQSEPTATATAGQNAAPTGLWERSNLLGDMGGLRTMLADHGVTFNAQETSELYGNFSGGLSRGVSYDGVTQFGLNADTDKAFGLKGGTFFVDALQIHGHGITASRLNSLQAASGAEAEATTRLWELWYQQALGDNFDVKIGQQSLDQEFIVSQYASTFANATFGWPVLAATDLPAGGPAYPLSSFGLRARFKPNTSTTILGGIFDGNPAPGNGDPQQLNPDGTRFNLHDDAMMIGEVQYAINQPPAAGSGAVQPSGLPGTYKLGFWYNNGRFADQHLDTNGVSLASPASNGVPATHRGNFSIYAVADQMVWRPSAGSPQSVGVFTRVMGAPGNRNVLDFHIDAGVVLKAPFKGRDNDSVGLALGYANVSSSASALDRDTAKFEIPGYPVRSAETVIEATYQYQVAPWWILQGELQYFYRPGGGIPNPNDNGSRVGNEAVVGLRTVVTF
ncbi:carbohydrate porin [Paraburkholderia sp. NMBU_R16]|uniref:carbohydrate porin n=1 Tax=Paraburkholderia sp. NMBU_R16 TaxID=2698676 RepID=UPI00156309C7|nr:carbohydrate porin [Paraburkholderia sp. NMBU_R16]NRO99305.1 carbohydrate porin [Paraburkholderia sp. NMBU_R16]